MGTEYYLVKPSQKEVFYLGKHFTCPFGMANRAYKNRACYIDQDCFDDFLWDFLRDNSEYFSNLKLEHIKEVLYEVYEWCSSDKIYFDNDCSDNREWGEWKEIGSLPDIIKKVTTPSKSLPEEFMNHLEEVHATILETPSFSSAIVGVTSDDRVVYDYDLMVEDLSEEDNISLWEAQEFIEYNTIRALPYMEADGKSPIILKTTF